MKLSVYGSAECSANYRNSQTVNFSARTLQLQKKSPLISKGTYFSSTQTSVLFRKVPVGISPQLVITIIHRFRLQRVKALYKIGTLMANTPYSVRQVLTEVFSNLHQTPRLRLRATVSQFLRIPLRSFVYLVIGFASTAFSGAWPLFQHSVIGLKGIGTYHTSAKIPILFSFCGLVGLNPASAKPVCLGK